MFMLPLSCLLNRLFLHISNILLITLKCPLPSPSIPFLPGVVLLLFTGIGHPAKESWCAISLSFPPSSLPPQPQTQQSTSRSLGRSRAHQEAHSSAFSQHPWSSPALPSPLLPHPQGLYTLSDSLSELTLGPTHLPPGAS